MMEHPGLNVSDIKKENDLAKIQTIITDLSTKMNFASRTGNQELVYQLELALNTYHRAYQELLDDQFGNTKDDNDSQIDIS